MIRRILFAISVCLCLSTAARAQAPLRTDSQSRYVHRIELVDEKGETIKPESKEPYSPRKTCGKCHDYKAISGGYHFHAGRPDQSSGRHGEPWFLTDPVARVQLPVSYRAWATINKQTPADLGLNPFKFAQVFGSHVPGGGIFETNDEGKRHSEALADKPDLATTEGSPYYDTRWNLSGNLEIDCLLCHLATPVSGAARADEVKVQNFRWAPVRSAGFGTVAGEVAKAGGGSAGQPAAPVDPEMAAAAIQPGAEAAATVAVEVKYTPAIFNVDHTVTLDVRRRAPSTNCLFCHYTRTLEDHGKKKRHHVGDVHTESGLNCTVCHTNDISHQITRGDGGPDDLKHDPDNAQRSCEGCHAVGGLGAPIPKHEGLPRVHLEKITCTACHSGPLPRKEPYRTQTSMAHGLGIPTEEPIEERMVPVIHSPAYRRDPVTKKIGVYRYTYPVWWGVRAEGKLIAPLPLEQIKKVFDQPRALKTDDDVLGVLAALGESVKGTPVYINRGRVYEKGADGKLISSAHPIAEAYFWPIAHDVRPVGESLGARSCADCHSPDSPFFFGDVIRDPLASPAAKQPEAVSGGGNAPTTQPATAKTAGVVPVRPVERGAGGPFGGGGIIPDPSPPPDGRAARGTGDAVVPVGPLTRAAVLLAAAVFAADSPATQPAEDAGAPLKMMDLTGYSPELAAIAATTVAREDQCSVCHAYKKLAWMDSQSGFEIPYVDEAEFKKTVHKDVPCLGCHTSIKHIPHGPGPHRVDCATTCHTIQDKDGKPYSHAAVAAKFAGSIHAARPDDTLKERHAKPTCTYCHMNEIHPDPRPDRPAGMPIVDLCSSCHADAKAMEPFGISPSLPKGFREQGHYKILARGDDAQANCVDCHTAHNTRPKEDPQSTIHQANLVRTCGGAGANGCHPRANLHFANTAFHMPIKERKDPVVYYTDRGFTYLTIGVMCMLVLHILLSLYGHYVTGPRRRGEHTA